MNEKLKYIPIPVNKLFEYIKNPNYQVYTNLYIDNLGNNGVNQMKEEVNLNSIRTGNVYSEYFQIGDSTYKPSQIANWEFYIAKNQ